MRYQQLEAAAHFGVPIDEFLSKPVHRQAEMIAHLMIRSVRQDWAEKQHTRKNETSAKKGRTSNPMDAQRRAWGLE